MELFQIYGIIVSVMVLTFFVWFWWDDLNNVFFSDDEPTRLEETIGMADSTRQMPEIDETMEIPEEDQEYLVPIIVAFLKKLAFSKRMIPTNAQLIEHLSESLGEAAKSFTPRSGRQDPPETGNENWLFVAAFATRLYMEGSAHNCREALDAFVSDGHLSQRRLERWAKQVNNEIARQTHKETVGDQNVRDITKHVETVGGTPYTADEVEDMKSAADKGESGTDSAFQQAIKNSKNKNNG